MPSNDEVVWGLPQIQCPTCQNVLQVEGRNQIHKLSKEQRKRKYGEGMSYTNMQAEGRMTRDPDIYDVVQDVPENVFVVMTCPNEICPQYSKLKVLRIPRIHTPSIKLDL